MSGPPRPGLSDGLRIYAIGDVHGHADLLAELLEAIERDRRERPVERSIEITLGDYVDRGPHSRGVIDLLLAPPRQGERICLGGNHETALLDFLDEPDTLSDWLVFGARPTLDSYGVSVPPYYLDADDVAAVRDAFAAALPAEHLGFLRGLRDGFDAAPYFFAHAGVRPGRSIAEQRPRDLRWIREPFLSSDADLGRIVVHGHTPDEQPIVRRNRICVDTGAFATGVLTAVVLEGTGHRFLTAGGR